MEMGIRLSPHTMRNLYVMSKIMGKPKSEAIRMAVTFAYVMVVYYHYEWSVWLKSQLWKSD